MSKSVGGAPVMRRQDTIMRLEINGGVMVPLYNRADGFELFAQWNKEIADGGVTSGEIVCGIVSPSKQDMLVVGKVFDGCDES
jgi:hypothetical protein